MTPEERRALASISERIEAENDLEKVKLENEIREANKRFRLPKLPPVDIPEIIRALKENKRKLEKVV